MTLLQHHIVGLAVVSTTILGFGLFVFLKNPKHPLNRSMALYCLSIGWWSGWECAVLLMPTRELSFLMMRIEYAGVALIPTFLCTTVSFLLNFSSQNRKRLLLPLYALSIATLWFASFHPRPEFLWISPGPVFYLPVWGRAGPYYLIFLAFFLGTTVLAHTMIIRAWYRTRGQERTRLALFGLGSIFAYLGACPEFALKYGIRLGLLNPFGLYLFPLYTGLLIYAVVQHQFFDIHIVIRRSLVYSLLVTFLTAGYFGLVYAIEWLFRTAFGYQSMGLSLIAFALMALLFQPLKVGIQRLVDWLIFRAPQEAVVKRMERLEQEALQTEKLKAVSTLAAGLAHEIKNPLTAFKAFSESVPELYNDPDFIKRYAEVIPGEIHRMQNLVQDLLNFAKPKPPEFKAVELSPLIHSTVSLLSGELSKRRIRWTVTCSHNGATLSADPDQLRQVLINLIQNAADAMPEGGNLSISTQSNNGHLELAVSDTGQGIPKELLSKIFDPFVTTKKEGNGLGLAMVHSIIQSHRGTIRAASTPGHGTTFTLRLPL